MGAMAHSNALAGGTGKFNYGKALKHGKGKWGLMGAGVLGGLGVLGGAGVGAGVGGTVGQIKGTYQNITGQNPYAQKTASNLGTAMTLGLGAVGTGGAIYGGGALLDAINAKQNSLDKAQADKDTFVNSMSRLLNTDEGNLAVDKEYLRAVVDEKEKEIDRDHGIISEDEYGNWLRGRARMGLLADPTRTHI